MLTARFTESGKNFLPTPNDAKLRHRDHSHVFNHARVRAAEALMKRTSVTLAAMAISLGAALSSAVLAADVSINVGDPGFYGRLDIGDAPRPTLVSPRPVIVEREHASEEPIYVYVPTDQQRDWSRYCSKYDACGRPVYFVEDHWYHDVYVPHYRSEHAARVENRRETREDLRDAKRDARDAKEEARDAKRDYRNARREEREHRDDDDR